MMCLSLTYDGAENMSENVKGAVAIFRSETGNYKAAYYHCLSHKSNFCISKASKVLKIFKMVSTM